jgi:hypothetical protein
MIDRDIIDRIKNAQKVTFPGGRGGSKAPGKSQGTPSASTKPSQNKTTNQSQSKTAIKQMQTSMIAFRTAFNQLAIGSNEVGRRSTGENLDNSKPDSKLDLIDDKIRSVKTKLFNDPENKQLKAELDSLDSERYSIANKKGPEKQTKDVHGLRPIGQILLNDYIGKDTLQGMTFADVDMKQPGRMGQGTGAQDNVSFVGVIDSIGRVGTPVDRQKTKQELDLEKQIAQLNDRITKESRTSQAINSAKTQLAKEYSQSKGTQVTPASIPQQEAESKSFEMVKAKYKPQSLKLNQSLSQATRFAVQDQPDKPGEEKEDGIWDVRTNNSLKNIAGITQGVLGFSKDMEINVPGYTQSNLESFKSGIPDDPELLRSEELQPGYESSITKLCNALTAHIKAQARYIELLRKNLFENPEYQSFMKQEKSLFDFNKTDQEGMNKKHEQDRNNQVSNERNPTSEMDNDTAEYYSNHKFKFDSNYHGAGIQVGINNKQWIVRFQDLDSVTSFENLYKRINGGNEPTKEQMLEFYNQINNSIQQFNQSKDYLAPVDEPLTQSVPYRVKVPSKLPWDRTETRYKTVPKN